MTTGNNKFEDRIQYAIRTNTCGHTLYMDGRDISGHLCGRPAVEVNAEGTDRGPRCKLHCKTAKAKRRAKSEARYAASRAVTEAHYVEVNKKRRKAEAYDEVMALLENTPNVDVSDGDEDFVKAYRAWQAEVEGVLKAIRAKVDGTQVPKDTP